MKPKCIEDSVKDADGKVTKYGIDECFNEDSLEQNNGFRDNFTGTKRLTL